MDDYPTITVVVPIRNEEKFIAQTVRYVLEQDYPQDRLEVLVVDGDSDDGTAEVVRQIAAADPRVKLLHNAKRLSSAARNIGARNATGDIITYIDGHTYIDNDQLLKNVARLLGEKEVSVLSRPQFLDTPHNNVFQKAVSLARKSAIGHGLDSTIYLDRECLVDPTSAGATYRREVFEKVGYFDEHFDASEDYEFNYRVAKAGFKAFTSLKLAVFYYPRSSLSALFRQMARYGTGRMRLARKHPETLSPGTLIPVLFTAGLVALPLLSIVLRPFGYLFLLLYGLYLLIVLAASASVAVRNGLVYLPLGLLIYPAIHLGLGYGFLSELIRALIGRSPRVKSRPA
ncbi:MAG TPA: glycosyltransferase family 2 protein [Acidobacteriota bacterium]|nr:glycosyltransferase family 2 protein [Acidobacteriota bacterium]